MRADLTAEFADDRRSTLTGQLLLAPLRRFGADSSCACLRKILDRALRFGAGVLTDLGRLGARLVQRLLVALLLGLGKLLVFASSLSAICLRMISWRSPHGSSAAGGTMYLRDDAEG